MPQRKTNKRTVTKTNGWVVYKGTQHALYKKADGKLVVKVFNKRSNKYIYLAAPSKKGGAYERPRTEDNSILQLTFEDCRGYDSGTTRIKNSQTYDYGSDNILAKEQCCKIAKEKNLRTWLDRFQCS